MTQVAVRTLNQDTAGVLARVKRGESIEITERGVVIARIVPAQDSPASRLIATGRLRMPTIEGPPPRPRGPVRTTDESGQLLGGLRGDERY